MVRRYIMIVLGGIFFLMSCTNSKKLGSNTNSVLPIHTFNVIKQLTSNNGNNFYYKDFASSSSAIRGEQHLIYVVNNAKQVQLYDYQGEYLTQLPIGIQGSTITDIHNFPTKYKGNTDVLIISESQNNKLRTYSIDSIQQSLEDITSGEFFSAVDEIKSTIAYYSKHSNAYYLFVAGKRGMIEQWELKDDGYGHIEGKIVRVFNVYDVPSALALDTANEVLYIAVNHEGIYKIGAQPQMGSSPTPVVLVKDNKHFLAENLGGIAFYPPSPKYKEGGLLVCSADNKSLLLVDIASQTISEQVNIKGNDVLDNVSKSLILKPLWGENDSYILSDNDSEGEGLKIIH